MQEVQTRLTKAGFDTGGTDGRVGNDTMKAVKDFQTSVGLPADGYAGLEVLGRLRAAIIWHLALQRLRSAQQSISE